MDNITPRFLHSPIMARVLNIRTHMNRVSLLAEHPSARGEGSLSSTRSPKEANPTESTGIEASNGQWEHYFEDPDWNRWKDWNQWNDWKDWDNWNKWNKSDSV